MAIKRTKKVKDKSNKTEKKEKKTKKDSKKKKKKTSKEESDEESKKPKRRTLAQVKKEMRERYENPIVIYESDQYERIPTRFPMLNALLGGGFVPGAIIEMFGSEDSGKTSLSFCCASDIQNYWKTKGSNKTHVVMVNFEGPDPYLWWQTLGMDTSDENFTQLRPTSLEQGMGELYKLMITGEVCAVIIDSVYAASSQESEQMLEKWSSGTGKGKSMAVEARAWGTAWTALKKTFQDFGIVVFAVNQIREVIDAGFRPKKSWMGKPTTTPRGKALKFYAWCRLELKGYYIQDLPPDVDGKNIRIKIIKNKTSNDARGRCEYDLIRGVGFDLVKDLIDISIAKGWIQSKGGWFMVGSEKIHGRPALIKFISSNQEIQQVLKDRAEQKLLAEVEDATVL